MTVPKTHKQSELTTGTGCAKEKEHDGVSGARVKEYHAEVKLADTAHKFVSVWAYCVEGKAVTYSVIQAQPPEEWDLGHWAKTEVKEDIRAAGRQTTLGPVQFQQFNANMVTILDEAKSKGGQRPTIHTGKVGHPQKPKTVAQQKILAKRGKTNCYPKPPSVIENVISVETSGVPTESGKRTSRRLTWIVQQRPDFSNNVTSLQS
ncbi:hypothetical protein BC835DRAFT_1422116 [Cytidiella melzeri]|nr:hypothetical protein BC835DRAFT_1422116 [Cytidiella melzeri]